VRVSQRAVVEKVIVAVLGQVAGVDEETGVELAGLADFEQRLASCGCRQCLPSCENATRKCDAPFGFLPRDVSQRQSDGEEILHGEVDAVHLMHRVACSTRRCDSRAGRDQVVVVVGGECLLPLPVSIVAAPVDEVLALDDERRAPRGQRMVGAIF